MTSFERVFNLAKKTGDRMVVFDSYTGEGFATIPFDEYEKMVTDPREVESLSGDDLLEQINHDIALWKAHQEIVDQEEFPGLYEEKKEEERPENPFEENYTGPPEWHTAGDILQHRFQESDSPWYPQDVTDEYDDEIYAPEDDTFELDDIESSFIADEPTDKWDPYKDLNIEPFPYDGEQERRAIPPTTQESDDEWDEEPLDEEPIFFEEPIE